jgi:hypothetical protein
MSKFCPECGSKLIADNLKFCHQCGEKLLSNNQEQIKFETPKKQQTGKIAVLIIGLVSFFLGVYIIGMVYIFPITTILGQGITLDQIHSLCANALINKLSVGSCNGINEQYYIRLGGGGILVIAGLYELIHG